MTVRNGDKFEKSLWEVIVTRWWTAANLASRRCSVECLPQIFRCRQSADGDFLIDLSADAAWADDPEVIELEVVCGDAHGAGGAGGFIVLEFEAESATVVLQEQVELCAGLGGIEPCVGRTQELQDLFECEAFPRGTDSGMSLQLLVSGQAEQMVQEARVTQIDFG